MAFTLASHSIARTESDAVGRFAKLNAGADVTGTVAFAATNFRVLGYVENMDGTIRTELRNRNPNFSGEFHPTFEGEHVIGVDCDGRDLCDITPLRALRHLQNLAINNAPLTDLSPLHGMPLESLQIRGWSGTDLSALKEMPLKVLNCSGRGQSIDLSPLIGLPLEYLYCNTLEIKTLERPMNCAANNNRSRAGLRFGSGLAGFKAFRFPNWTGFPSLKKPSTRSEPHRSHR